MPDDIAPGPIAQAEIDGHGQRNRERRRDAGQRRHQDAKLAVGGVGPKAGQGAIMAEEVFMAVSRLALQGAKIALMIGSWSPDRERRFNSLIVSASGRG